MRDIACKCFIGGCVVDGDVEICAIGDRAVEMQSVPGLVEGKRDFLRL